MSFTAAAEAARAAADNADTAALISSGGYIAQDGSEIVDDIERRAFEALCWAVIDLSKAVTEIAKGLDRR